MRVQIACNNLIIVVTVAIVCTDQIAEFVVLWTIMPGLQVQHTLLAGFTAGYDCFPIWLFVHTLYCLISGDNNIMNDRVGITNDYCMCLSYFYQDEGI